MDRVSRLKFVSSVICFAWHLVAVCSNRHMQRVVVAGMVFYNSLSLKASLEKKCSEVHLIVFKCISLAANMTHLRRYLQGFDSFICIVSYRVLISLDLSPFHILESKL